MMTTSWDDLAAGVGCPFDEPRAEPNDYWDTIARLRVSTLCLHWNQVCRGASVLIFDPRHVVRPDQLTLDEWRDFSSDAYRAVKALMSVCRPDHINVEILGSVIPHLHWHIIPRYKTDPRWGGPIWTKTREELREERMPEHERAKLIADLGAALRN